jgi:hypothetical protein
MTPLTVSSLEEVGNMFPAPGFAPVVAFTAGTLIAVGVVIVGLMAIYAIWWLIFRMGKDGS